MKKNTLLLIGIIFSVSGFSQAPPIQWQNTIGGFGTDDFLYSIQQTADGGYILGGYSNSNISGDKTENCMGKWDYWMVKTDATGNIQWQNTIGGSLWDGIKSIQQTADRGYIMGGVSVSNISGDKTENCIGTTAWFDYWVVKTDSLGNIQWQNTIGGTLGDALCSVRQTTDGGYIIGGVSSSNISGDKTENSIGVNDYWIVKTDSLGNIQWQNTIGGSYHDVLYSMQQTTDGGYILGGTSSSNISGDKIENNWDTTLNSPDYWIVKTDSVGYIQWQNTIGGSDRDALGSVQQTADGGYILGGTSSSNISGDKMENSKGWYDYWLVKTDSLGNIQWQKTIGGSADEYLRSVWQTIDGGYFLGGDSRSNISGDKTENNWDPAGSTNDYWVVKTDSLGNIQWENTIGGSKADQLNSIQQATDGGYILGGFSESNTSGDKTEWSNGGWDYWIVKLAPEVGIEENSGEVNNIIISPNPAINEIRIESTAFKTESIEIYDVLGQRVYSGQTTNSKPQTIDVSKLNSGIYFVKVKSETGERVAKFVKE